MTKPKSKAVAVIVEMLREEPDLPWPVVRKRAAEQGVRILPGNYGLAQQLLKIRAKGTGKGIRRREELDQKAQLSSGREMAREVMEYTRAMEHTLRTIQRIVRKALGTRENEETQEPI